MRHIVVSVDSPPTPILGASAEEALPLHLAAWSLEAVRHRTVKLTSNGALKRNHLPRLTPGSSGQAAGGKKNHGLEILINDGLGKVVLSRWRAGRLPGLGIS